MTTAQIIQLSILAAVVIGILVYKKMKKHECSSCHCVPCDCQDGYIGVGSR